MTDRIRLGARIDKDLRAAVVEHCASRGMHISRFVEEALRDKLAAARRAADQTPPSAEPSRPLDAATEDLEGR